MASVSLFYILRFFTRNIQTIPKSMGNKVTKTATFVVFAEAPQVHSHSPVSLITAYAVGTFVKKPFPGFDEVR